MIDMAVFDRVAKLLNLEPAEDDNLWAFSGEVIEAMREQSNLVKNRFSNTLWERTNRGANFLLLDPSAIAKAALAALKSEEGL